MNKYIDFHTHINQQDKEIISIYIVSNGKKNLSLPDSYYCLGIHPWYIESINKSEIYNLIKKEYLNKNFFALGEIGLDKISNTDYKLQTQIFEEQIHLAQELKIKTLIVHSVKAYSDILSILKNLNWTGKLVLHGFNSTYEMAKSFDQFETYFSFGFLLYKKSKAQDVITKLPLNKVFLETDDQKIYSIKDIYHQASILLNITEESLRSTIMNSFKNNFTIEANL